MKKPKRQTGTPRSTKNRAFHRLHSIRYDYQTTVQPTLARIAAHWQTLTHNHNNDNNDDKQQEQQQQQQQQAMEMTLFLNQRCGTWYHPPTSSSSSCDKDSPRLVVRTCHFKSTDGHTGSWLFSLKRLNLPVLYEATTTTTTTSSSSRNRLVMILDASARKALPDSLSRTVPLWAAVMNRVAAVYRQELGLSNDNNDDDDDDNDVDDNKKKRNARYFDLQTPRGIVSRAEHEHMQTLVRDRARTLLEARAVVQPQRLAQALASNDRPLTPFWIMPPWPRTSTTNHDNVQRDQDEKNSNNSNNNNDDDWWTQQLPTAEDWEHCCPILCVHASSSSSSFTTSLTQQQQEQQEFRARHSHGGGFWYTPGAADDEESWARGLTADLYHWHGDNGILFGNDENETTMSRGAKETWPHHGHCREDEMDARIDEIVALAKANEGEQGRRLPDDCTTLDLPYDTLGLTGIAIGSRRAGRPPDCWDHFDAILNVTDTTYPDMVESCHAENGRYYLQLPVQEGKRDKTELERWMTVGICFCVLHAQAGRRVLIHCAQGKDRSVSMALAVVALFCDLRYPLRWKETFERFSVQNLFRDAAKDGNETIRDSTPLLDDDGSYQASGIPMLAVNALLCREGRNKLLMAVHEHNCLHELNQVEVTVEQEGLPSPLANKESLRIALHLIRQDREQAEPTRSSMQKLNRFFMSGAFEKS